MEQLSDHQLKVAKERYFMDNESKWEDLVNRVIKEMIKVDNDEKYLSDIYNSIGNMEFLPAGRILRNIGRLKSSMMNCNLVPIEDSIEQIGENIRKSLSIWSYGGGVGINFSSLRPKGTPLSTKGGTSSGLVSFLQAIDGLANTIESGGQRRAAGIAICDIAHPEVEDFIDVKLEKGLLSHFNLSVAVNSEFLEAVEKDDDWDLKFSEKVYKTVKARMLWEKILANMIRSGEPGLLNWNYLVKNNSYYFSPIVGTNPCITGDTLIAVADGRNHVSIKQLAEEGKDVPVYSFNNETKKVEVKMMRKPRKTGTGKKILKIELENGGYIRCTENHKIYLKNSKRIEAKDLKIGDSLHHMTIKNSHFFENRISNEIGYNWIHTNISGYGGHVHRIIGEYNIDRKLIIGEVAHHKDFNPFNNSIDNIEVMTDSDHKKLHAKIPEQNWLIRQDWSGKNNPMYGKKHAEESKRKIGNKAIERSKDPEYKNKQSLAQKKRFVENPNAKDYLKKEKVPRISATCDYCGKEFILLESRYNKLIEKNKKLFCSISCSNKSRSVYNNNLIDLEIISLGVKFFNEKNELPTYYNWNEWSKNNNGCDIYTISKKIGTFEKFRNYISSNQRLNFKVVNIIEDGFEDVYNGTVDDNHNYYIFIKDSKDKNGENHINWHYSLISNCGEICLPNHGSCCLGAINLTKFVIGKTNATNWKKLEECIKTSVRFLDNIIDLNYYPVSELEIEAKRSRRIGLGIMGLGDFLVMKKIRYGSEKCLKELEDIFRFFRNKCYETSIELAKIKKPFPMFDKVQYGKASFIRKLPAKLRLDIKEFGIRNSNLNTCAPTGTTSLIAGTTSGIEPIIYKANRRNDRISERVYIHPLYEKYLLDKYNNINPDDNGEYLVDTMDLKPEDHLEVQSLIQQYIDSSISKTINLPSDYNSDSLGKLLLEYIHSLKGVTVYRDGSRDGQVCNMITEQEALDYVLNKNKDKTNEIGQENLKCHSGKCDL